MFEDLEFFDADPELLEQRIGRLDRIGQTEDIQIHVPFLVHSPQVASIKVERRGKVRRAKLFYLRDRVGKATRVKQRFDR